MVVGIVLYYRDKGEETSDLSKQNMSQLKEGIKKRNLPLDELVKFHNVAVENDYRKYKDADCDQKNKLRKKWKDLYIYSDAD